MAGLELGWGLSCSRSREPGPGSWGALGHALLHTATAMAVGRVKGQLGVDRGGRLLGPASTAHPTSLTPLSALPPSLPCPASLRQALPTLLYLGADTGKAPLFTQVGREEGEGQGGRRGQFGGG